MPDPRQVIPFHRLPPGFLDTVDQGGREPAIPRPAATVVLIREGERSLEILLLRRSRSAGFVPGAFVFPGGRVDEADGAHGPLERMTGLSPEEASQRLGLQPESAPSAIAYYVSAVREAFEETGLLPGTEAPAPPASRSTRVEGIRNALMTDAIGWSEALTQLGVSLSLSAVEYIAHWITPTVEPRRYDTRFFAAEVGADSEPIVDPREMLEAIWISPSQALARHEEGSLPMVFPTLSTITALRDFKTPGAALNHFREREIPTILPRLVRTSTGIGLEVDE